MEYFRHLLHHLIRMYLHHRQNHHFALLEYQMENRHRHRLQQKQLMCQIVSYYLDCH